MRPRQLLVLGAAAAAACAVPPTDGAKLRAVARDDGLVQAPLSPPALRTTRQDEDYAYLRDPAHRTGAWWEPWKYLPLDAAGDTYLTIGGELRSRYEVFRGDQWGEAVPPDRDYGWHRALPYADLHLARDVRLFAQGIVALETGDEGERTPIDEDRADVLQAFCDLPVPLEGAAATVRVGRQVLALGSERLLSSRYGPNVMRSFDVVKCTVGDGATRLDGFYGRPVDVEPGAFDDRADASAEVWAVYGTTRLDLAERFDVELYYIGLRRDLSTFEEGAGRELRHTVGTRWAGAHRGFDWNTEVMGQFGTFGNGHVRAWSIATDTGHTFGGPWTPRVGLRADVVSGDRSAGDGDLETFHPLFPRGKYFGEIGLIGPYNLVDLHPSLELHVAEAWTIGIASVLYWRQSVDDGVYDIAGGVLRGSGGSGERHVGTQWDLTLDYEPDRCWSISIALSTFVAGSFLRATGPDESVHYAGAELRFVF